MVEVNLIEFVRDADVKYDNAKGTITLTNGNAKMTLTENGTLTLSAGGNTIDVTNSSNKFKNGDIISSLTNGQCTILRTKTSTTTNANKKAITGFEVVQGSGTQCN